MTTEEFGDDDAEVCHRFPLLFLFSPFVLLLFGQVCIVDKEEEEPEHDWWVLEQNDLKDEKQGSLRTFVDSASSLICFVSLPFIEPSEFKQVKSLLDEPDEPYGTLVRSSSFFLIFFFSLLTQLFVLLVGL
jgi:hypothetical protein